MSSSYVIRKIINDIIEKRIKENEIMSCDYTYYVNKNIKKIRVLVGSNIYIYLFCKHQEFKTYFDMSCIKQIYNPELYTFDDLHSMPEYCEYVEPCIMNLCHDYNLEEFIYECSLPYEILKCPDKRCESINCEHLMYRLPVFSDVLTHKLEKIFETIQSEHGWKQIYKFDD